VSQSAAKLNEAKAMQDLCDEQVAANTKNLQDRRGSVAVATKQKQDYDSKKSADQSAAERKEQERLAEIAMKKKVARAEADGFLQEVAAANEAWARTKTTVAALENKLGVLNGEIQVSDATEARLTTEATTPKKVIDAIDHFNKGQASEVRRTGAPKPIITSAMQIVFFVYSTFKDGPPPSFKKKKKEPSWDDIRNMLTQDFVKDMKSITPEIVATPVCAKIIDETRKKAMDITVSSVKKSSKTVGILYEWAVVLLLNAEAWMLREELRAARVILDGNHSKLSSQLDECNSYMTNYEKEAAANQKNATDVLAGPFGDE